ncbi:DUF669 domain-containing protein [Fulvimarina sp. 2208YS6-2-32]|uniref:DUF669 domain-containing protein n=1 Tax=Fulvimarina uroteuthidis TaxID=3098149 RepID=A0ABU5HZY1_9HYPH|nr:DUF669 domain-containing protein [Fulvimarina sp. 2208YS6-2-32]MDY8108288.1 DUF669 domain-containing protein [Fulvimarina sp. 2208YS6-2-32]
MVDISGFNANDYEPTQEYEALPEGKYHAEIVASEEKEIGSNGDKGTKLTFQWKIQTGACEGRIVFQDILHNYTVPGEKGDKTREIASRNLSAVCHAVGRLAPANTEELHNIPCEISVGFQKPQIDPNTSKPKINPNTGEPYPLRNEVKGVKPWNGQSASAAPRQQSKPAAQSAPQTASAPAGGGWARRAG